MIPQSGRIAIDGRPVVLVVMSIVLSPRTDDESEIHCVLAATFYYPLCVDNPAEMYEKHTFG